MKLDNFNPFLLTIKSYLICIQTPDIDINARFDLKSDWIKIKPTNTKFLFEIEVLKKEKKNVDSLALLMQYHGNRDKIEVGQLEKVKLSY